MDLSISTTSAQIGIQTTPGNLEIQQPKADMTMEIEHSKIEIHTEHSQVVIDQRQCFAEAGLKNITELTRDTSGFTQQKLMEGIDRIVRQGNELAAIHSSFDVIPNQAEENAFHWKNVEINIESIPRSRPEIDFVGGDVDIQVKEGKIDFQVHVNKPMVNFSPGKVEFYLKQKNSIKIDYVGKSVDTYGG